MDNNEFKSLKAGDILKNGELRIFLLEKFPETPWHVCNFNIENLTFNSYEKFSMQRKYFKSWEIDKEILDKLNNLAGTSKNYKQLDVLKYEDRYIVLLKKLNMFWKVSSINIKNLKPNYSYYLLDFKDWEFDKEITKKMKLLVEKARIMFKAGQSLTDINKTIGWS